MEQLCHPISDTPLYERKTSQNKASTIRRLVNLKYRETKSASERLSDLQRLINQLTNTEMVLEDELQALLLLSHFPDNWDTLVVFLVTRYHKVF